MNHILKYIASTCTTSCIHVSFFSVEIAAAIGQLCEQAAKADMKETNTDWLFVLPIYHFMKKSSEPFMAPEYNPEKVVFRTGLVARLGTCRLPQGLVNKLNDSTKLHTPYQ